MLEISTGKAGLAFGQTLPKEEESKAGKLYVMDARGVDDAVELVTGLAASGCHSIVMFSERKFVPQHEMVPVTVVSCCGSKDEKVTLTAVAGLQGVDSQNMFTQYALAKDSKNNKNVMGIEPDTCYQNRLYAFSYNLILRP